MSTLLADLRFAIRLLLKKPLFTALAVTTLAIGIGLNTAVFSAVDALLTRPLPGTEKPDQLVQLYRTQPGMAYGSNSIPHWRDVRERTTDIFSDVALWNFATLSLSNAGKAEFAQGQLVSANYFATLGVTPLMGRVFSQEEEVGELAHPVVVLSYDAWQRRFGGAPDVIGKTLILNGATHTVIGVAQRAFQGALPIITPELWIPLTQIAVANPEGALSKDNRGWNSYNVIARLAPGVTATQASERLNALSAALLAELPDAYQDRGIALVKQSDAGIHPMLRSAQVGLTTVVMAVVVMLLLIACVNVANLFLARAQDRWREMAVRLSLGARRRVLIRQLLTESVVFALVSGIVGVFIAWWAISLANNIRLPVSFNFSPDLRLSVPVLLFTLAVTLGTSLVFGVAPALQATRPALIPALKGEAPAGGTRSRLSNVLVVAQMALSLVLLVCAGLFLRNLRSATDINKGFDESGIVLGVVDPSLQGYSRARSEEFYRRLFERLRTLPGVQHVAAIADAPLGLSNSDRGVTIPGYEPAPNEGMSVLYNSVIPGYFETMGIPLRSGRDFTATDDSTAARVAVVNERFVERFWPDGNPVGRTFRAGGRDHTIIGVVPTGKYRRLGEPAEAYMYFAQSQQWRGSMTLVVKATGEPSLLMPRIRAEVAALDPDMPLADLQTMTSHLGLTLLPARLTGTVLGIFGILGLLLAAVGMYGVMSYSVAQRTREIGIRMAIGAARGEVIGMVMRQGLLLVLIGGAIGLAAAFGAAQLIRGQLYGASGLDPLTFFAVPLVLLSVAALATWLPARRAADTDPVLAMRAE